MSSKPSPPNQSFTAETVGWNRRIGKLFRTAITTIFAVGFLLWMASTVVVVDVDAVGLRTRLGTLQRDPLLPGIHWGLPFPLDRVRQLQLKRWRNVTVGFRGDDRSIVQEDSLWTKTHGDEELPLLTGSSAELIVVNGLLTYRLDDSPTGLCNFCVQAKSADEILLRFAEQIVAADVAATPLDSLLSADRGELAARWASTLQARANEAQLGLKVERFGILAIHPPVEVAAAYLDVGNARTDVQRQIQDATTNARSELTRTTMLGNAMIADAKADAEKRLTQAEATLVRVSALADHYTRHPEVTRQRLVCEELSELLKDKPFVLVDSQLSSGTRIWIEGNSPAERNSTSN